MVYCSTNISTANKLKKHKIAMVGTVCQNQKDSLEEIDLNRRDELYTSRFLFSSSQYIMMFLYKMTKANNVYLLSSMHSVGIVEDADPKKWRGALLFYTETNDTADEMLRGYLC